MPAGSVITSFVDFLITLGADGRDDDLVPISCPTGGFWPAAVRGSGIRAVFRLGLWLCALNVKYRDFRYIVPFIVQFGLYISPVGFSSTMVPAKWRLLYSLNPMVGVIDGFRWSLLRGANQGSSCGR